MDFTQSPDREDRDGKKWRNIRDILQHFKVSDLSASVCGPRGPTHGQPETLGN